MKQITIKKGLDIPIGGKPRQIISDIKMPRSVALLGTDYVGMKPQFAVKVGDNVKRGQLLFSDRKTPDVSYTSPAAGRILSISRGHRRMLLSVIIEREGSDEINFRSYSDAALNSLKPENVVNLLLDSGLWTALRARPFGKVADPTTKPDALFVTAIDTNPLAPSMQAVLQGMENYFEQGLRVLGKLTDGSRFLCVPEGMHVPCPETPLFSVVEFSGPHPAGNVGTHIHLLTPVARNRRVWHIGLQDVIATGLLFTEGRLHIERVISLAGPLVKNPRLIRTMIGASVTDSIASELKNEDHRVVSGSVLSGHVATDELAFLGRYHQQISVIPERGDGGFLGWARPGFRLFSIKNVVASRFIPKGNFLFTTARYGELRAIYPIGCYEKVMPLNIMPTFLLKALAINDVEEAERLGCLELDEEDLALCSFVCPSKIDHGANLRSTLTLIEKEG